jgi:Bacterial toxin 44
MTFEKRSRGFWIEFSDCLIVQNNPVNFRDPLGLEPPPNIPPGINVMANMEEASHMSGWEFFLAVNSYGKWDFKNDKQFKNRALYENYGNYHYGLVASAFGWEPGTILRMAGLAQHVTDVKNLLRGEKRIGRGCVLGGEPYGDDAKDQMWIKEGIRDYLNNYYGPSPVKVLDLESFRSLP